MNEAFWRGGILPAQLAHVLAPGFGHGRECYAARQVGLMIPRAWPDAGGLADWGAISPGIRARLQEIAEPAEQAPGGLAPAERGMEPEATAAEARFRQPLPEGGMPGTGLRLPASGLVCREAGGDEVTGLPGTHRRWRWRRSERAERGHVPAGARYQCRFIMFCRRSLSICDYQDTLGIWYKYIQATYVIQLIPIFCHAEYPCAVLLSRVTIKVLS